MNGAGDRILRRVEMWCARNWYESQNAALEALAASDSAAYARLRQDEGDWMNALLIVNRVSLGIEPLAGETFMEAKGSR
jgi:hypothetical protein